MFGLACKGLHCAGCGKGIPLSVILFALGLWLTAQPGVQESIKIGCFAIAGAQIMTVVVLALLVKKGPRIVFMRTDRLTYGQMKYLETGDEKWLVLTGGKLPVITTASTTESHAKEVVLYDDPDSSD